MTTISGHTTRATGTILTAAIYNFDHNNHVNNANALNTEKIEGVTPPVVAGNFMSFANTGGAEAADSGVSASTFVPAAGGTFTGGITVARTATNSSYVTAEATDAGAASGPQFTASRVSSSPAGGDLIGKYIFRGNDSALNATDYAYFQGRIDDPTDGSEDASIIVGRMVAGVDTQEVIRTAGKNTIWMPAPAMIKAAAAAGPASGQITIGASLINYLAYDNTNIEDAVFSIAMPKDWNEGQISAQFVWFHPATVTNFGVTWNLFALAYSNNEDIVGTGHGNGTVTDTGGTTNRLFISDETSLFTVGNSPNEGDWVQFICRRNPTDGGDTLAVDAFLIGIRIFYTSSAPNDR